MTAPLDLPAIKARAEKGWAFTTRTVEAHRITDSTTLDYAGARRDGLALVAEVERLRMALLAAKIEHRDTCSRMSGDPDAPDECTCGAVEHNDRIDRVLEGGA